MLGHIVDGINEYGLVIHMQDNLLQTEDDYNRFMTESPSAVGIERYTLLTSQLADVHDAHREWRLLRAWTAAVPEMMTIVLSPTTRIDPSGAGGHDGHAPRSYCGPRAA